MKIRLSTIENGIKKSNIVSLGIIGEFLKIKATIVKLVSKDTSLRINAGEREKDVSFIF